MIIEKIKNVNPKAISRIFLAHTFSCEDNEIESLAKSSYNYTDVRRVKTPKTRYAYRLSSNRSSVFENAISEVRKEQKFPAVIVFANDHTGNDLMYIAYKDQVQKNHVQNKYS